MDTPLGEVLKKLRVERKYTQKNMAEILGIARTTYTGYELGTITPPMDKITAIMNFYEITEAEFNYLVEHEAEVINSDIEYVKSGLVPMEIYELKNVLLRLLDYDIRFMNHHVDRDEFIVPLKRVIINYLDSVEFKMSRSQKEYDHFKNDRRSEYK